MADLILDEALELGSALPIVLTSSTRMARMTDRERRDAGFPIGVPCVSDD
jgi:hypothetical protein